MTTHVAESPQVSKAATETSRWQRLLALSGVAFAPLFVVGWLTSAVSNAPNYIDADQKWIKWAHDVTSRAGSAHARSLIERSRMTTPPNYDRPHATAGISVLRC